MMINCIKNKLTAGQKNIYMMEKLSDVSNLNNIFGIINVNSNFELKKADNIINKIVEQNDALRINIVEDVEPYQIVREYKHFCVENIKIDLKEEATKQIDKFKSEIISLEDEKLYRFKILYDYDKAMILVKMHHIISDAWSFSKIAEQFISMYENDECIINTSSYIDYSLEYEEYLKSEKYKKDEEFFKKYLDKYNEVVSFKPNEDEIRNTSAKRYSVKLDEKVNNDILSFCKNNRVSPYVLFLTALYVYMYRVLDKNDIVIGTPVLNRSSFKEKQILGMFVSTLPLRIKIEENMSIFELLKLISSNTLELFRHQKYPYMKTLEYVHKNSDIKSNLYRVVLSYQNARINVGNNDKYNTSWEFLNTLIDELQIHIVDMDNTGVLSINYDYQTFYFKKLEIKYMHTRIMSIIKNIMQDINQSIETIEIMSDKEKDKIIEEFNDTYSYLDFSKNVINEFDTQALNNKDKPALVLNDKIITYEKLQEYTYKFANYLSRSRNIKKGDIVAIQMEKSFELIISILSVIRIGAIFLPLDNDASFERNNVILNESGAKCIIKLKEENTLDTLQEVVYFNKDVIEKEQLNMVYESPKFDDGAYMMFTSGTTGKPKGVINTQIGLIRLVKNINYVNIDDIENVIIAGSNGFDASIHEIFLSVLNGKTGILVKKDELLNIGKYKEIIQKYSNSLAILTPQLFNEYAYLEPDIFNKLNYLIIGGDELLTKYTSKVLEICKKLNLINIYGPTECSVAATTYKVKKDDKIIPIGKPISNTKCFILDKKQRLLPIFCKGEIYIAGIGIGKGYINNARSRQNSFIESKLFGNIYRTGDIGKYLEDGNIIFYGRIDNQLKINGHRVEFAEIYDNVFSYEKGIILQARILVDKNENRKKMKLYFVSKQNIDTLKLRRYLEKKLPAYMIPEKIIQVEKLTLKANGKVDDKLLITCENVNNDKSCKTLPKKELNISEQIVLKIVKEELQNDDITVYDNLFDYGIDSIQIAKIIAILKSYNIYLEYQDFYNGKNINDILNGKNQEKIEDLSKYNYTRINKELIEKRSSSLSKKILLVGATGFVGIHVLSELLQNKSVDKVYCIVRKKQFDNSYDRLKDYYNTYFKDNLDKYMDKIEVLDINLLDSQNIMQELKNKEIDTIINSAGNVKHYGLLKEFYESNVTIVENLINLAKSRDIKLIHVSTLSICGNSLESEFENQDIEDEIVFDETKLFIGQKLRNVYVYTKFLAERTILEHRADGLNATIIRLGNITNRSSDYMSQYNIYENAFIQRIKFYLTLKTVPNVIYKNAYLEFSPVDMVAKAITNIMFFNEVNAVYHIYNNNHVSIQEFIDIYENTYHEKINISNNINYEDILKKVINDNKLMHNYIVPLMELKNNNNNLYNNNIIVSNKLSNQELLKNNFRWSKIDSSYIKGFLKNI